MDNEWQDEIIEKLNAACAEGTVDLDDSDSVHKFLTQEFSEDLPPDYNGAVDDEMLALYIEQEELKLKIREEKRAGKYTTFHKMLLKGELLTSDPFVMDILCKLTIKNDKEKIKNCKECLTAEICPKRSEIIRREKNGWGKNINKALQKRNDTLKSFEALRAEGITYESAKADTCKEQKICARTFDTLYATHDKKNIIEIIQLLSK